MLIHGEKWACRACVRGHRANSCKHIDNPLLHIKKKGRPVSQCAHCRGLRNSRSTHVKCECGDREKAHSEAECYAMEKDVSKYHHQRCCCSHGQPCKCASKKDYHNNNVRQGCATMTQPTITELHKPRLTPRKSERNLAISKADQKTPTHMHNDVALIGETTNIISRTHISHSPSYVTRPSLNHLPMSGQNLSVNKEISSHIEGISSTQTTPHVNSENGSIHMASVQALDQSNNPNSSPNMDPFSILSAASLSQTENLPFQGQLNKQFYNQSDIHLAVSQENDAPVHPAIRSAPWMDWPTSNMSSAKSNPNSYSQPLSYASFDDPYFGFSGFTPSSDDILEADQFLPFLTIDGASNNDAYGSASHNVDSESDLSHITPFSDGHTTANVLPLAPSNLKSIDIDEILKVAETDASTLQRQL